MTEARCASCGGPILYEAGANNGGMRLTCPRCSARVPADDGGPVAAETVSVAEAIASLGSTVGIDPYRTGTIVLEPEAQEEKARQAAAPAVEVKVKGFLTQMGLPPDEADFRLRGVTAVGRLAGDVVVDDPSMSARHFQIEERDGQFYLRDLESSNGTFLNDREVRSAPLQSGDRIQAGSTLFTFSVRHTIPT